MSISEAIEVLEIEAAGILDLIPRVDGRFEEMIEAICASRGRLIVSGIGKSGIVARKIVATLNSTGTRAIFLHPVEAMHGDLGMVSADDIFLAISNSGETDELNILVSSITTIGCRVIAFTGNLRSTLAAHSDIVIDTGVKKEACPLGLAPTASTTAQLAMGDALAVVLINRKHFKSSDFKRFHPGGALGQRLSASVAQLMFTEAVMPKVTTGSSIMAAIREIDRLEIGVVMVVDAEGHLMGILTDGDIRRLIARDTARFEDAVDTIMTRAPRTISPAAPAYDALNLMEQHQITVLPVTDDDGGVVGVLHLHDILGKGEFNFNGKSE
jgi:arabinose-5-phosphate isomerase